jgi:hypothetical protein
MNSQLQFASPFLRVAEQNNAVQFLKVHRQCSKAERLQSQGAVESFLEKIWNRVVTLCPVISRPIDSTLGHCCGRMLPVAGAILGVFH